MYSSTGQARVEDVLLHAARPGAVPTQGRAWVPQVTTERQPSQCCADTPRPSHKGCRLHQKVARVSTGDCRPGGVPLPDQVRLPIAVL